MADRKGWAVEPVKDRTGWTKEPATPEAPGIDWATEANAAKDNFLGDAKAAADTASLGIFPRVLAAGDALGETLNGHGSLEHNYDKSLTDRQTDSAETARKHPSASIVGGFLTPSLGMGSMATPVQRAVGAGLVGATAGNLEAKHDDPSARLAGSLSGGLTGMGLQGINEASGPLAKRFGGMLRDSSGANAANVAGGGRGQIGDRLKAIGIDPLEQSDFGNKLLDAKLIPSGLHPTEDPATGVLTRARALKRKSGADIGEVIGRADAAGEFDPLRASSEMSAALPSRNPLERDNSSKARKFIDQVTDLAPQGNYSSADSFKQANRMKSQAWDAANFKDDAPLEGKQYRKAVQQLRDSLRDQVGEVSGPDAAKRLGQANEQFGLGSDAENLSANAVSRGGQAQKFGLPSALMMAVGAGAGAAAGGVKGAAAGSLAPAAAMIGSSLLKARGPAVAARLGRVGSDAANAVGNMSQNPAAAGSAGSALERYFNSADPEERKKILEELKK